MEVARIYVIVGHFLSSVFSIFATIALRSFENVLAKGVYCPFEILMPNI